MIDFEWNAEAARWTARVLDVGCHVDIAPSVLLLPLANKRCALLARPGVTVNGMPVGPFRMLTDRDEIHAPEGIYCFSAGTLPEVRRFEAGDKKIRCPRCLEEFQFGEEVVHCPHCDAPYHPTCFDHGPRCAACGNPLELWVPAPISPTKEGPA